MGRHRIADMDKDAAKATLEGLFDRIDALVTQDGVASKEELAKVFGEHAAEFLQFCDKDSDEKLSKDEFTSGILNDCGEMSQEDFNANWAERMEACVKEAEGKAAPAAPAKFEGVPYLDAETRQMMYSQLAPLMHVPGVPEGEEPSYEAIANFMSPMMFNPDNKPLEDEQMAKGFNPRCDWEQFKQFRPYAQKDYESKAPKVGDIAPDGPVLSLAEDGESSTLLTEAKKLAAEAGTDKVVLGFDGMTCMFWRSYCAEQLYKAAGDTPILHIYSMEAEPEDKFDAGGSQSEGHNTEVPPMLHITPAINEHKDVAERRLVASKAKSILETFNDKPVTMVIDDMDNALENAYETRPWRYYVIEAESGKVLSTSSLAPFNIDEKTASMKAALAQ